MHVCDPEQFISSSGHRDRLLRCMLVDEANETDAALLWTEYSIRRYTGSGQCVKWDNGLRMKVEMIWTTDITRNYLNRDWNQKSFQLQMRLGAIYIANEIENRLNREWNQTLFEL